MPSEDLYGAAAIRQGVACITRPRWQMNRRAAKKPSNTINACRTAAPDVDRMAIGDLTVKRAEVSAHYVADMVKSRVCAPSPMDGQRLAGERLANEDTHHRDIDALGRHARSRNVEVAQTSASAFRTDRERAGYIPRQPASAAHKD